MMVQQIQTELQGLQDALSQEQQKRRSNFNELTIGIGRILLASPPQWQPPHPCTWTYLDNINQLPYSTTYPMQPPLVPPTEFSLSFAEGSGGMSTREIGGLWNY